MLRARRASGCRIEVERLSQKNTHFNRILGPKLGFIMLAASQWQLCDSTIVTSASGGAVAAA